MQGVKALDKPTPAELWREVPESEDEFWRDTQERQLRMLRAVLEEALLGLDEALATRGAKGRRLLEA